MSKRDTNKIRLVEKFVLKDKSLYPYLYEQMKVARDLENQTLYLYYKAKEETGKGLSCSELQKELKSLETLPDEYGKVTPNYRRLTKVQSAQQIIKRTSTSIDSAFKSLKRWKENPSGYTSKPNLPTYNSKSTLYSSLIYTNQCSQIKKDEKGRYRIVLRAKSKSKGLEELSVYIPKNKQERFKAQSILNKFQQIRIIPVNRKNFKTEIEVEIVYNVDTKYLCSSVLREFNSSSIQLDKDKVISIDIGEVNFVTCVGTELNEPFIIKGTDLRALNKTDEAFIAHKKSILPFRHTKQGKKYQVSSSKRINRLHKRRARRNRDFAYKAAAQVLIKAIQTGTGSIVVGYNKGIKTSPTTSKIVNQTLSLVPWRIFIDRLEFLCALVGINLIIQEESYTSKCDALAFEEIKKQKTYLGRRTDRNTFVSSTGVTLNADVNGALNILRKAYKNGDEIIFSLFQKENFIGSLCRPSEVYIYNESRYAVPAMGLNSQNTLRAKII